VAISDETGAVVERMAFDAWGKRRFVNGTPDVLDSIVGWNTDRGYTMHEHLDEMGVIHMNGRIYDPLTGRFMSADPFIQDPAFAQSYNRYAYVMNNPLAYTDPSGYFSFKSIFKIAVTVVVAVYAPQLISGMIANGAGMAAAAGLSGASAAAAYGAAYSIALGATSTAIISGAVTGFVIGGISSGTISGAFQGALTGGLFGAAGGIGEAASAERYLAHATAGCISQAVGGGSCGTGAASAVLGKYVSNVTESWGPGIAQGAAAMVAGGVGSVIAGGKFENGAKTAAFGYLFNRCMNIRACFEEAAEGFVRAWKNFGEKYIEASTTVLTVATGTVEIQAARGLIAGAGAGARTEAANIAEQYALAEARAGAGWEIMSGKINDPRFVDLWKKMSYEYETKSGRDIVIHFWERIQDGVRTGFKFKNPP